MFRRILVTLDGSTFAEQALPYAVDAARRTGAELHLLLVHVRQSPVTADLTLREAIDEWETSHANREASYLAAVADRLRAETGLSVKADVLHGEVVPAITRAVEQQEIDLVVITTHGRAGLERAWLGSVADALIREIDAPVLVVRPAEEAAPAPSGFRHLLIALDGSDRAERAIAPALSLAGEDAQATLFRAVTPPSAVTSPYLPHAVRISHEELERRGHEATTYLADVAERLSGEAVRIESATATDYHPARAVLHWAREHDADLIALGTHGRGPVRRLVLGSVTDKIVRAATVPVLVC
jgi:nucleotide-binding universal stress UspA family protein